MDGIGIPILGFIVSVILGAVCVTTPSLRRFTLAALVSPFATSIVFLLGGFILADMNPAREYGAAYIPTGKEHDPTGIDYVLWILTTLTTLVATASFSFAAQRVARELFRFVRDERRIKLRRPS